MVISRMTTAVPISASSTLLQPCGEVGDNRVTQKLPDQNRHPPKMADERAPRLPVSLSCISNFRTLFLPPTHSVTQLYPPNLSLTLPVMNGLLTMAPRGKREKSRRSPQCLLTVKRRRRDVCEIRLAGRSRR